MNDFFERLNSYYDELSEAEQEVIDFILQYKDIENLKLKNIQEELFVSTTTIIRACKKLKYPTFNLLKLNLYNAMQEDLEKETISSFQSMTEQITRDFERTMTLLSEEKVQRFCRDINQARRIFCIGVASSASVTSDFNRKLKLLDKWSNDYLEYFSIERVIEIISPEDVIVVFSLSGENTDINELILKIKSKGAKILSVTNISNNSLNRISDSSLYVYFTPSSRKKVRSRLMLNVAADIIYETLLNQSKK